MTVILWDVNMRYVMKQKLFCRGGDFTIKTQDSQDVFFVDGKALSRVAVCHRA